MIKSKCCKAKVQKYSNGYFCSFCFKEYEPTRFTKLLSILFISIFSISCLTLPSSKFTYPTSKIEKKVDTCDIELKDSCILQELIKDSCYFPEIALKQFKIETGNYTSEICILNKNIGGLKCNCKYSLGIKNKHSYYKSYKDCIKCYVNFHNKYWQQYCKNYAEDKNYLQKLK